MDEKTDREVDREDYGDEDARWLFEGPLADEDVEGAIAEVRRS